MAIRVPASSTETVYFPVKSTHPINGPTDLSILVVEVAVPLDNSAPSVWVTTTWESGTKKINGERYYLARIALGSGGSFTLSAGNTYRAWCRITTGGSNKAMIEGGQIVAI